MLPYSIKGVPIIYGGGCYENAGEGHVTLAPKNGEGHTNVWPEKEEVHMIKG